MSRNSNIIDGDGTGAYLKVNEGGYVLTQSSGLPPKMIEIYKLFIENF